MNLDGPKDILPAVEYMAALRKNCPNWIYLGLIVICHKYTVIPVEGDLTCPCKKQIAPQIEALTPNSK